MRGEIAALARNKNRFLLIRLCVFPTQRAAKVRIRGRFGDVDDPQVRRIASARRSHQLPPHRILGDKHARAGMRHQLPLLIGR